ncbi:MADS-box MEF2 type transcription factor [Gaeumannomyces tritici R3-111a-1]|uniref:MADS-box MEF2 type transcription factor MIG1 n=1 Tax=Gaeumannomyces tritici (strain R3-111a-1) TaxID=644352 RepID=J3NRW4_GAET3|nr:MADS-box MEF2 type transcription factor [Gaeumannomyces tritici R3-111a-1]EJT78920.1 MADS-box MEF2 type transcription factor [Gaeumannomyces tritici R3-111a-1]
MGRRKIEIKAIKDDRNRSVTFLKRKGGLFKKAHELSVLCSVDVAVFIFGTNKKLYEYSSGDMRELITRYTYHGGATEHKGPSDFNGGADDDEDEDVDGTPPRQGSMDAHMLPPHFQNQQPFPQHMRHHTPSASPPIPNSMQFTSHGHAVQRQHTPQPQMGSRPPSRGDMRRMMGKPVGPPPPPGQQVNGFAFVPQPAIYGPPNPTTMAPHVPPQMAHGPQYPPYPQQPPQHAHQHQMHYLEDQRRASMPPSFPPHVQQPPHAPIQRHSVSPPQAHPPQLPQMPPQHVPHTSPPPQHLVHSSPQQMVNSSPQQQHLQPQQQPQQQQQQPHQHTSSSPQLPIIHEPPPPQPQPQQQQQPDQARCLPPPPAPMEIKTEPSTQERVIPQTSLLDTGVKKLPRQKQHSIFTPIDENRSILSQHLAAFHSEPAKTDKSPPSVGRSSSLDGAAGHAVPAKTNGTTSPPPPKRAETSQTFPRASRASISSLSEAGFTPPSRSNSLRAGGPRPRLKVQIPDEQSDDGTSVTAESASSPRGGHSTDATSQSTRQNDTLSNSSMVLPPPSPSASALLSAGATGPPNPFARRPPQQLQAATGINMDTPVSALPSRFLNTDFLPSPSSFYPEWNFRGGDNNNTLPSPLNFATPVVGSGPSFLRDDNHNSNSSTNLAAVAINNNKRKSPDHLATHHEHGTGAMDSTAANEPKRVKVDS